MTRPKLEGNKNAPPYWRAYASNWIANENFMLAPLIERGLMFSIFNYCWENETIPADPKVMARMLGIDNPAEVTSAFGKLVRSQTEKCDEDQSRLRVPFLEKLFCEFAEMRKAKAEGGRRGGQKTQAKIKEASNASRFAKGSDMKRSALNSSAAVIKELSPEHEEWIADYEGGAVASP